MKKILITVGHEETSRRDVTDAFRCANSVKRALEKRKYSVDILPVKKNDLKTKTVLIKKIKGSKTDCVFNLFEGFGSDPHKEIVFSEILEESGMPFTGNPSVVLKKCLDKSNVKKILSKRNIPVPKGVLVKKIKDIKGAVFEYPIFVKPCCEDASVGIDADSLIKEKSRLYEIVKNKLKSYPKGMIIEEFITGNEYNAGYTGYAGKYKNMGISETDYSRYPRYTPFFTYDSKWNERSQEFKKMNPDPTAKIKRSLKKKILAISRKAARAVGCGGYFRVDMREKNGRIYVLEVNPNPDINEDSGFMRQAYYKGLSYADVVENIVKKAVIRK